MTLSWSSDDSREPGSLESSMLKGDVAKVASDQCPYHTVVVLPADTVCDIRQGLRQVGPIAE